MSQPKRSHPPGPLPPNDYRSRKYNDLAIPSGWRPVLRNIEPVPTIPEPIMLQGLEEAVQMCLDALDDRGAYIAWNRLAEGRTLEEIGAELQITRERVRQIQQQSVRKLLYKRDINAGLMAIRQQAQAKKATAIALDPAEEAEDGTASEEQLLRFIVELWRHREPGLTLEQSEGGVTMLVPGEEQRSKDISAAMKSCGNFATAAQLAEQLKLPEEELADLPSRFSEVQATRGGKYFAGRGMSQQEAVLATARILREAGFERWHTSQLVKAAGVLNPDCLKVKPLARHNLICTRENKAQFRVSGKAGWWELGDPQPPKRIRTEAIEKILGESDAPLHWKQITRLLNGGYSGGSVQNRLYTNPNIKHHGGGYFGLKGQEYPAPEASDQLMRSLFEEHGEPVPLALVEEASEAAGIKVSDLKRDGRYSRFYCWYRLPWKGIFFTSRQTRLAKRFKRWEENPSAKHYITQEEIAQELARLARSKDGRERLRYHQLNERFEREKQATKL